MGGAARFWRRGGNRPRPGLPPQGETGKGGSKFLAAAGFWPLAPTIPLHMCHLPASRYRHLKAGIPPFCESRASGQTVAPLTTTVMNAVQPNHSGAASGINNAVSRGAGLLAVAVLDFMLIAMFNRVWTEGWTLFPPVSVRHQIDSQRSKLAAIETVAPQVRDAVAETFLSGYGAGSLPRNSSAESPPGSVKSADKRFSSTIVGYRLISASARPVP